MKNPDWYYDESDQLHREDGPAIISNGIEVWYKHGKRHREDGPAYSNNTGYKEWLINGKCHRTDGPAIIYKDGTCEWWVNGQPIDCQTQEEFEQLMRLKEFW